MSASCCIAFFGLRFELRDEEIIGMEDRSDIRIQTARRAHLQYYWGNFGGLGSRYLLYVGTKIGILGPENSPEVTVGVSELNRMIVETTSKLSLAKLNGEPQFYFQWLEDV